jgi:hypothetical protein
MSNHPTDFIEELAEEYLNLRAERLAIDKRAAEAKKHEDAVKQKLEKLLLDTGTTDYKGDHLRVQLEREFKPTATDWGLVQKFVIENDAFDLYHRRLTESAVKARWEDGISIPGIDKFPVDKLSITKA